ncbi:hypothetical protein F9C28_18220 [Shimwellia pseudoproteus]|uniref:hypothetical protein n=1 Tax=Shimwellia pseudoproteus TaxID=570012 RepID=UPI0018EC06FB|nr:hypothetical protein [Shimwellia pseudoproteus]MBJ3816787.1 hypothetical protein [Shimwellia pseudoproteus]
MKIPANDHPATSQAALAAEIIALYGEGVSLTATHRLQGDYQALFLADNYGLAGRPARYYPFTEVSPLQAARRLHLLRKLPYIVHCDVVDFLKAQGAEDHGARAVFEASENEIQRHWMFLPGTASSIQRGRALCHYRQTKVIARLVEAGAISDYMARQADNARYLCQVSGRSPGDYDTLFYYSDIEQLRHDIIGEALHALDNGAPVTEIAGALIDNLVLSKTEATCTAVEGESP